MGFQEALQVGKKYLRLPTGRKVPIRNQHSPSKNLKPGGFTGNPAGGLFPMTKDNFLPIPKKEVGALGGEKKDHQMTGRLLHSFPERKNAELEECSRGSKEPGPDQGADDQIALVFFLTRKLLSKNAEPLDPHWIRDDARLERALGKVHPRLPVSIRLVLRKKRYIQFMLDNRERLIP